MISKNQAIATTCLADLNEAINVMLNAILHHPQMQKLESAWRSVYFLTQQVGSSKIVKIRMLDVSWQELHRDVTRAIEFDQSHLFQKVYSQEFGMPGGEPYGVIIGDYSVSLRTGKLSAGARDIATLEGLSEIAAAAFVPMIFNVEASSFGINHLSEFEGLSDLASIMKEPQLCQWQQFRQNVHSRFIGLTLPKVLARSPYNDQKGMDFPFVETVSQHEDYLWGHAAFAFASRLIAAFKEQGWFIDIQGQPNPQCQGGLVSGLPMRYSKIDSKGLIPKQTAEIYFTDKQEKSLAQLGFIPLCQTHDTKQSIFYSSYSVQKIANDSASDQADLKVSAMLQYLLCASRFAHFIKILGRDKIGAYLTAKQCESYLNQWLLQYVANNEQLSFHLRAAHPLRSAQVKITPQPGMPGVYHCVIHIEPRFQLEQIESLFILTTELTDKDITVGTII